MFTDYRALLDKIDRLVNEIRSGHPGKIACRPGCNSCCVSNITVWRIEHDRIRQFVESENPEPGRRSESECPFLNDDGLCSIYPVRPVVCRLWGIPKDMINADLILTTLAAINCVYCKKFALDPEERLKLE